MCLSRLLALRIQLFVAFDYEHVDCWTKPREIEMFMSNESKILLLSTLTWIRFSSISSCCASRSRVLTSGYGFWRKLLSRYSICSVVNDARERRLFIKLLRIGRNGSVSFKELSEKSKNRVQEDQWTLLANTYSCFRPILRWRILLQLKYYEYLPLMNERVMNFQQAQACKNLFRHSVIRSSRRIHVKLVARKSKLIIMGSVKHASI